MINRQRQVIRIDLRQPPPIVLDFRQYPCPGCGSTEAWKSGAMTRDSAQGLCRCGVGELLVEFVRERRSTLCPDCDHGIAGGMPCATCGGSGSIVELR